ncbi:hypothetical protein Glove_86g118 [Diversispora epigaea]|uniref:Uncharacterized protein n=1 Tax=Diversispora epigaea TaxID=1348612 RepID=A0A397JG43_9GLOM|nr:hypothetical protein Glove_86g118 [Diversispora epigaea]
MPLLLGLVERFSRPTSSTFRPTVFFPSTATLFDNDLLDSRAINDLQPALENDILPNCVKGVNYAVFTVLLVNLIPII